MKGNPMKLQKLLFPLLLLLLLAALLVGCGKDPGPAEEFIPEETLVICNAEVEDFETYNIIYSSYANDNVKEMIKDLQATVKEATGGVVLKYSTDTSKLTVETPYEIIIGKTVRPESVNALAKIEGVAYRIERSEKKIVITASNDKMLKAALERFKEMLVIDEGTASVTVGLTKEVTVEETFPIMVDGKIPFRVILPSKGYSDDLYNAAKNLCTLFSDITEQTFKIEFDGKVEYEEGAYEICIGNTNRAISQELYEDLTSPFEYRVQIKGNQIAVAGALDTQVVKGLNFLQNALAEAYDGTYAGIPTLPIDFGGSYDVSANAKDLVLPDEGTFQGLVDCGKDCYILYYKNAKQKTVYDDYVAKLQSIGARVTATYTLGENSYTLLKHNTFTAYVSYLVADKAMRIYVGSPDDLDPSTAAVADAKKVTPKLFSIALNYYAGGAADGGMSYVIQLSDGKFLVFDGGYWADADNLYNLLVKYKPSTHKKPIIAGWFISHLHGDHYGCLNTFSGKYSEQVEVEGFYHNFPYVPMGEDQTTSPSAALSVEAAMRKWTNAKLYRKLHSGEYFNFSGATVTVLCTLEDVYPNVYGDGNDTSTVVRVDIAGQRIIFTGDANPSESAAMCKLGTEVLKADMVQFAHHGYPGCSTTFYQMVDPETVLWPLNILDTSGSSNRFAAWYNGKNSLEPNRWVAGSDNNIKKVIIAGVSSFKDTPYEVYELPYKPKGAKIVDYNAICQEQKAAYDANR